MSQKLFLTTFLLVQKYGSRNGKLESIVRVAVFPVQWPSDQLIERFQGSLGSLCDMTHDRMHGFALVVSFFTLDNILGRDTSLRKIDIT